MIELVISRYKETSEQGQQYCVDMTLRVTTPDKELLVSHPLPALFAGDMRLNPLLEGRKVQGKFFNVNETNALIAGAKALRDRVAAYLAAAVVYGKAGDNQEIYPPKEDA